jgi:3-oxoacyl-[acyl-carrier-protein] synthase II
MKEISQGGRRDALITGIGLVSCLGEGPDAHWEALDAPGGFQPVVDTERFAPWLVHPIVPIEFDRQIPKRGDQRQMEAWQRIGTYAAGLALESAGIKGNTALLGRTDMIVAAGGGERDRAVDEAILSALPSAPEAGVLLNERLMSDLRPTLFLAQLSNLLAGNISIVHGVVGSSRTFMGEEAAGVDAVRIACARIAAGQGEIFLVGGSYNAERPEVLLQYELGRTLLKQPFAGVWERQDRGGGMVPASIGCFLVIESRAHAAGRGATAHAHIAAIASDRCRRAPGEAAANASRQFEAMRQHIDPAASAVISGATGVAAPTQEERAFLRDLRLPIRASGTAIGHSLEPSFPANLALAAVAVSRGRLFGPLEPEEEPMSSPLRSVLVTGWGHWRGEGMAVVEAT